MELTEDSLQLLNLATKINYVPDITECLTIAEAISKLAQEDKIVLCGMAEALHYCCKPGKGISDLESAYIKVGHLAYPELKIMDTEFDKNYYNDNGTREEKIVKFGNSPFAEKRMAEVYAAIYNLEIAKW